MSDTYWVDAPASPASFLALARTGLEDAVMDCAYLWRDGENDAWTFLGSPDWDLCEEYEAVLADAPVVDRQ